MRIIKIKYDKREDILYIYFSKNRSAVTIELEDDILLRKDPSTDEIISLEILGFSKYKIEYEIEEPLRTKCRDCKYLKVFADGFICKRGEYADLKDWYCPRIKDIDELVYCSTFKRKKVIDE